MFRTLLQVALTVFVVSITTVAQSKTTISGATITTRTNGDFVHPTFSPDGKTLAYSKVLLKGEFENSEVVLHDLSKNRQTVLLGSKKAATYATYKAAVTGMKWTSASRLEVEVSDGDVGLTYLTFNPLTRRLLKQRVEDLDELEEPPLSLIQQKAYRQARSLFPSFPDEVLDEALHNRAFVMPERGILLQKNYAGHDHNIWFLDFQNKSASSLLALPAESMHAFGGGVEFKSAIVFALTRGPKTHLYLYQNEQLSELGQFNSSGYSWIEVKHASPSRVIFLLRTYASYERGDNPLFIFDGRQLLRVNDYSELYDVNIDPRGRRIAYCYWAGDKRHLAVKELIEPLR